MTMTLGSGRKARKDPNSNFLAFFSIFLLVGREERKKWEGKGAKST
jgi:hypothetical protein